jgi:hypothetical protein
MINTEILTLQVILEEKVNEYRTILYSGEELTPTDLNYLMGCIDTLNDIRHKLEAMED